MDKDQIEQKNSRYFSIITKKNCLIFLFVLFLVLSVFIAFIPYDPEMDLADATTNAIWIGYYEKGIYHIPYDEWDYPPTQSVVVEYEGNYVVVNEKGPGHVMMLLPFHILGVEFIFGPLMVAIAVFSTYMLGKRLCSWHVGFLAGVMVLLNSMVLTMWHRYYWTDASTMHMLILSIWLLVEAIYWYNGGSINPKKGSDVNIKQKLIGIVLCFFSGLTFGISVSTKYPTGLILIAMGLFILTFYLLKVLPDLKKRKILSALKKSAGMWIVLGTLILGLMVVLVPLMQYNSAYFDDPFGSGYDATSLLGEGGTDPYEGTGGPSEEGLRPRNTSMGWLSSFFSLEKISTIASNFFSLLILFIIRMPYLVFVPVGIWFFRKKSGLILLFFLVFFNFCTFLTLPYLDMYISHLEAVWEPRYFMPAMPAIALLGGIGIYAIAKWIINNKKIFSNIPKEKRRDIAIKFVAIIVCIILIVGVISTFIYFVVFRATLPNPRHPALDDMNLSGPPPHLSSGADYLIVQSVQPKIKNEIYISQKIVSLLSGV